MGATTLVEVPGLTQPTANAADPAPIDTTSRDSVQAAYLSLLKPALNTPVNWSGTTTGCIAGAESAMSNQATLAAINFMRAMDGLKPVAFDAALSSLSQQAALMMAAAYSLSHSPGPTWPCYTADGATGAGSSNLALGFSTGGAQAILAYMDDDGDNNFSVGHRRWIMMPEQTMMGTGSTSFSNALYVLDFASWRSGLLATDPEYATWPTAGYVPLQIEPAGRWSFYRNSGSVDFTNAVLTVTRHDAGGDVILPTVVLNRAGTLVWRLDPGFRRGMADRLYTVRIDNFVREGAVTSYQYRVKLFDADYDRNQPARLLDTRSGQPTADNLFSGLGLRSANSTTELQVTDRVTIPLDTDSVVLNVTVTEALGAGYITVYPCGTPRPLASNVNFKKGSTVANVVVAQVGAGGKVCFYNSAASQLIVDISGNRKAGTGYVPVVPERLLETRGGLSTIDGQFNAVGQTTAGGTVELVVAGRRAIPADASTVVVNVTAVGGGVAGFVTQYPCGQSRPNASNVSVTGSDTVANAVVAKVGADGKVCLFTSAPTDLIVDISGYFVAGKGLQAMTPARLLDTRSGYETTDGVHNGTGRVTAGSVTVVQVAGRGGVPLGASAAVLNVTATEARLNGFVVVYPCGQPRPMTSSLNFVAGADVANTAVVRLGAYGTVCAFALVDTHLVVDANGYEL